MSAPQYDVECPTCHEPPEKPCRTLRTWRVTDTHTARIEAAFEAFATRHSQENQ